MRSVAAILVVCAALCANVFATPALAQQTSFVPGVSSPTNAIPYVTNFDPALLPHARAAFAKVRQGVGRAKVLALGDSLTAGFGAGTKLSSYPAAVAKILAARGLAANSSAMLGTGNAWSSLFDPSVVPGTGWFGGAAGLSPSWEQQTNSNTLLSKSFTENTNQCDVYYLNLGSSTFSIDVDGAGTQSISVVNVQNILVASFTGLSLAAHTVNVQRTSASGSVLIMAIDCYNVTTPVVSVMNGGWSGSTALQWSDASHGYSITNAILALAPDLCIYEIGTNEENGSSTVAQEAAYYQAVVTACKASGDIILMMHHDNNLTSSYQATTLAAMQSVAASNNVPLINMYARMGPYSQLNALGEIYSSTVHLSATGYADKASFIANLLLSL